MTSFRPPVGARGARVALLVALGSWVAVPAGAVVVDLDLVPALSEVAIEPTSGIYFDRSPEQGGTVFVPFATQTGAGVGGPTNGLRAALTGRIRIDFRPDDETLRISGFSTLFAPLSTGAWLPGVAGSAATPAAAQAAVALGGGGAFATGRAALRELAISITTPAYALAAAGAGRWDWPADPAGAPVELRIADGRVDFAIDALPTLASAYVREGGKQALALSAARRVRVIESTGDRLELRMPLAVSIEQALPGEPGAALPLRVRVDLDGELVARSLVPEPGAASAALAAIGALALLSRRRARVRRAVGRARALLQIASYALLIGASCGDIAPGACFNDDQCSGTLKCVENECTGDASCENPADCAEDEICDGGTCVRPADAGEPCEGSRDCRSHVCTSGVCGGCQGDEDCDGISDSTDQCPRSPMRELAAVNADGCAETRTQPDGTKVFANGTNSFVATTEDGLGPCSDCAYLTPEDIRWEGFDASLGTSLETGLHFTIGGAIRFPGFELDCSGATCEEHADGAIACQGDAGECQASWPQAQIDCGESACTHLVDDGAFAGGTLRTVFVSKLAVDADEEPADGSFDFQLGSGPQPFVESLTTSGGVSTRRLLYTRSGGPIVVSELVPSGWTLDDVTCSQAFERDGSKITVTGFHPSGVTFCTFYDRRVAPSGILEIGLTAPDAIARTTTFGLPPGHRIAVAGANGLVIVEPLTGTIPTAGNATLSFLNGFLYLNLLGALVIPTPAGDAGDAIFAYRNDTGGSIRTYVPEIANFGAAQVSNATYRDAVQLGNDPAQSEALLTTTANVQRFGWTDFGNPSGGLFPTTDVALGNFGAAGTPISAFTFPASTRILAVTTGTPGKLVLGDPAQPFQAVSVVGDVGNEPRRIRCLGSVCAVSNFGSDSLTIVTWNGATSAAITDTQGVGDGPIGIDLRALPGGNVAVASTGFDDSTYAITVVSPAGEVVASASRPAPDGCEQPGHALWLGDPEQHLVLSCFGSDALAVLIPEIPSP